MKAPLRRGACPGLSAPMPTGDGLLVRMLPIGTIPLGAFAALCAAARQHGNGIVEITARGSIQVRGLSPASAPRFAAAVAALGVAAADGIAVHVSPLAGLDPDEIIDAEPLAAALRRELAERGLAAKLAPKMSVVIDGGGAPALDWISADVRLRAELTNGQTVFALSVGGDRRDATQLGFVAPANAVAAVIRILEMIAQCGRDVRARDVINHEGVGPLGLAVRDLLSFPACESGDSELDCGLHANKRTSVIGVHPLRGGLFACGAGLAFGHADATSLEALSKAAAAGATGLRAVPDRALIFTGFSPETVSAFAVEAKRRGFIVRADDPRRFVVACAGAPICASAYIAARELAPRIAADCARALSAGFTVHVSGCAKGCAHPTPATLTVVGTPNGCGLVSNGTARDGASTTVPTHELAAAVVRFAGNMAGEVRHV